MNSTYLNTPNKLFGLDRRKKVGWVASPAQIFFSRRQWLDLPMLCMYVFVAFSTWIHDLFLIINVPRSNYVHSAQFPRTFTRIWKCHEKRRSTPSLQWKSASVVFPQTSSQYLTSITMCLGGHSLRIFGRTCERSGTRVQTTTTWAGRTSTCSSGEGSSLFL